MRAKLLAGPDLDGVDLARLKEGEEQSLLAGLVALRARLFHSLSVAEEAGDGHMISRLSGQLHRNYELVGKLIGSLATGDTNITNNVLIQPLYLEMRGEMVRALQPYPAAREAVAEALRRIEHKAAVQVTAEVGRGLELVAS